MFNWTWPGAGRVRGTHCGRRWYLYPPLPSMTLSSQHKAHLIGWASLCLPGPQPNAEHQTLFDALTFSLSFSRLYAASLCSPVCEAPSRNTSPAAPQMIPCLSDDTGPQGFLPDMIWDLAVARGPLSVLHTLLHTRAFQFILKIFLSFVVVLH